MSDLLLMAGMLSPYIILENDLLTYAVVLSFCFKQVSIIHNSSEYSACNGKQKAAYTLSRE